MYCESFLDLETQKHVLRAANLMGCIDYVIESPLSGDFGLDVINNIVFYNAMLDMCIS